VMAFRAGMAVAAGRFGIMVHQETCIMVLNNSPFPEHGKATPMKSDR
jgi:hypothetical protein